MKKILSAAIALTTAAIYMLSAVPAVALTTSMETPAVITDPEYMFPAFYNDNVLLNKKQGRLPAMGWNSWNPFGSANTEALTKAQADAIVDLGLAELGYEYVVLDDGCYKSSRDENGYITNDTTKFPSGFKALGDYIHSKGLKFGMYNDIGTRLCAGGWVGTVGNEDRDARQYKEWGVDFLKVDNCYYLWDNATYSASTNAQYVYAPRIRAITVNGNGFSVNLSAVTDGTLMGSGAVKDSNGNFVNYIGTKDGTNVGVSPVGDLWSELAFTVNAPADGEYSLVVNYASGAEIGTGRWLQAAVGEILDETRCYDDFLPDTGSITTFKDSPVIKIELKEGDNLVRLMNHRRQENTLYSYAALLDGLNKYDPDHDTVLSICEWGKTQPHNWGFKVGDSWRILNDITFSVGVNGSAAWESSNTASIASQYNKAVVMDEFAGLNRGWNDAEMLVIGMKGITTTMSKSHMSMWCMINSPLMLGMDLRNVQKGDEIYNIIANEDVIALNQDVLGIQAKRIYCSILSSDPDTTYTENNNRVDILAKPLANGDVALIFVNMSQSANANSYSVNVDDIVSYIGRKMVISEEFENAEGYVVKDLWTKETSLNTDGIFSVNGLVGCDSLTIRISPLSGSEDTKAFLKNEIDAAEELLTSKDVHISAVNSLFTAAVTDANAVYENTSASTEEILNAYTALAQAETAFNEAYEAYDLLGRAISASDEMISKSENYLQNEAWDDFIRVIEASREVYENPVSSEDIYSAIDSLNAAKAAVDWNPAAGYEPLAWYVFNDRSSQTVKDVSDNGNDATLVNSGAKILEDNVLSLNANNENDSYLQLPSGILSGANEFTFASWVKIGENRSWARLFDFGMSSTNGYMFTVPYTGTSQFRYAITSTTSSGEQQLNAPGLTVGEWIHVAVRQSSSTVTIYYNGEPVSSRTITLTPASTIKDAVNCYIGKSQYADPYLKAELKDIRIYDRALTEAQINSIANGTTGEFSVNISADSNVNFELSNMTEETKSVWVIAAKYTEDGSLGQVFTRREIIDPISDITVSSEFDFGDEETEVKAFVWDENISPFIAAKTVILNESPRWSILRKNSANYTINSDTSVTITSERGDLWGNADGAGTVKNLYLIDVPDESRDSFTAEVTVKYKPSANYQRAALIAYAGDGNQVSVMRRFHSSYNGNVFMTTMNTAGKAGSENVYTADNGGTECRLKIVKSGSEFRGYYSLDNGATWSALVTRTQSTLASSNNLRIGFYASNGEYDAASQDVTFENFTLDGRVINFKISE